MKRLALVLLLSIIATGCTRTVYIDRHTLTYSTIDSSWLTSCKIVPPPNKVAYQEASERERLDMWTQVYIDQAQVTKRDNLRLKEASDYNEKRAGETIVTCNGGKCK